LHSASEQFYQLIQTSQFSDVIAIAGNQRHLQTVSLKKPPELCVKKSGQQNASKLQDKIAIKSVILGK